MAQIETEMTLEQFLVDNPQDAIQEDIDLAARFTAKGFKFTITAMTGQQYADYQKEAVAIGRKRKVKFDSQRFNELVVINHTLKPNFKDAELCKKAGCSTAEQFMYRSLRAGEIAELANRIALLSGFDPDPEASVEKVKNS